MIDNELKRMQICLEVNKLSRNVKKTKYIIFHYKQKDMINHTPK